MAPANTAKPGLFVTEDGQRLGFTFALVCTLFFLWAMCNGMIDVMDKHFQDELGLTKSQSAWVQFAHYLGYFLMSMPAGILASKLGYKGGIIAGLVMVAAGGFWFIPATHINALVHEGRVTPGMAFVGFLAGVCFIAAGLTFLETIANPYTTVLGAPRFAATRINLAQSCNGLGWIFGPPLGGIFFYGKDAAGRSTGSETLYIPYVGLAIGALLIATVFYFANVPDIRPKDALQENGENGTDAGAPHQPRRAWVAVLLLLNAAVLIGAVGMIVWVILGSVGVPTESADRIVGRGGMMLWVGAAVLLGNRRIPVSSPWGRPHFSGAVLAQFLYVAAQAGIFSFFINYMTEQTPALPQEWAAGGFAAWFTTKAGALTFSEKGAANIASVAFGCFLLGRVSGSWLLKKYSAHKVLGLYGVANVVACLLVFLKMGWFSVFCVFLSYFFMSIMFPTIFALGIFGLGARAKKASAFIVMAIMGGAILPKLMGAIADQYDMSRGFIVPMVCFAFVAFYGFQWPRLSGAESLHGAELKGGH